MDLLHSKDPNVFNKPKIVRIGNGYFRRYHTEENETNENKNLTPYTDNDDQMVNCAELDDDIEIKVTKSGQFLSQIHVAPYFFAGIVGIKGLKRKEIETSTNTHIKIPKPGETGDIVITGTSERDVYSARTRINMVVLQMRDKHQITHFVSIPVISDQIRSNFLTFKSQLLNGPPMRGIDESIFQSPEKLHLTIATFILLDDIEVDNAVKIMQECKDEIIEQSFKNSGQLKIVLEGVEIMNDDQTCVDVLYGKVKMNIPKYNSNFQKMADQIVEHFARKGIIRKQYDSVKLHVTLMNSRYRKVENNGGERSVRESFDSSFILNKYKNFYFGEADFDDIHLSVRFTTSDSRYYESCIVLPVK